MVNNEIYNKATDPTTDMEQNISNAPNGPKKFKGLDSKCHIHIHSKRIRETDPDGCCGKYAIDALVYAQVLQDDRSAYISGVSYSQEKVGTKEREETIITLEWDE